MSSLWPADVAAAYRSLFEASHRTRYDHQRLGGVSFYKLLEMQYDTVKRQAELLNGSRPDISTQAP